MANVHSSKRNGTVDDNANGPSSKRLRNNRDISDEESLSSNRDVNTSLLITPRENEFNARTWWMVDLYPAATSSPQGATELVKRCMTSYSWDEAKTRKVLAAYRKFLLLKKIHKDWNAEVLSPCYLVDQMWHCHILDVVNYCHDMMLLCGHVVGHNPSGALDIEAKQKRDHDTRVCLLEEFGDYDEEIWDYSPNPNAATAVKDRNLIRINIKDQKGEVMTFKINKSVQMRKVFKMYSQKKGVDEDENGFRFMLDAERIQSTDTAKILELNDGDQIDAVLPQRGC